jgi:hypothetical protein
MVGFIDGEGCFNINIRKSKSCKSGGYQVVPRFVLVQHVRDLELINIIRDYLGCGTISNSNTYVSLTVSKLSDINNKIIPLLIKYPLQGAKKSDFILFCRVLDLIKDKAHLTTEGLAKIQEIKGKMNRGNLYDNID